MRLLERITGDSGALALLDLSEAKREALERRSSPENPNTPLSNPDEWLVSWMSGGGPSAAGIAVGPEVAMRCATVNACVRILAETIASLPLQVFERLDSGGKRLAPAHRLYSLLHDEPNPEMSSFVWRETGQGHLSLRGNSYNWIDRDNARRVRAVWPLHPDRCEPFRDPATDELRYRVWGSRGETEILLADEVLHVPGLSWDGRKGLSPISQLREAIGLALATEAYGARFFSGGSRPGGLLSSDQPMSPEKRQQNRDSFEAWHKGIEKSHRVAVLDNGLKWQQVGLGNEDSQFIQTRQLQVTQIASAFRIPLMLLQYGEKTETYASSEQFMLSFVKHTIRPISCRWEQECNRKLFSPADRGRFFVEFNLEGLLRGDLKSRMEAFQIQFQNGIRNADEIREVENLPPRADGLGGVYMRPANIVPAGTPVSSSSGSSGQQPQEGAAA